MESGLIADGQITASSSFNVDHKPYVARLRLQASLHIYNAGAWAAGANDVNQWLQVDLGLHYNVTRVATQGKPSYPEWVTMYNLQHSDDGVTFLYYKNKQGQNKVKCTYIITSCSTENRQITRPVDAQSQ